jgi:hypothetical protein
MRTQCQGFSETCPLRAGAAGAAEAGSDGEAPLACAPSGNADTLQFYTDPAAYSKVCRGAAWQVQFGQQRGRQLHLLWHDQRVALNTPPVTVTPVGE